jgi:hypothetical protein
MVLQTMGSIVLQKFLLQKEYGEQKLRFFLAIQLPYEPRGSIVLQENFTDT